LAFGLYVSRCGGRVGDVIDVDELAACFERRAAVTRVVDDLYRADVLDRIERDVMDAGLDGIVLAGHSPGRFDHSLSGRQIRERLVAAGVNPNRISCANILEQVALPHAGDPEAAKAKARALLEVAILEVTMRDEVGSKSAEPRRSVLILGATAQGIIAAQRLLQLGYRVVIADRADGSARIAAMDILSATAAYVLGHEACETVDDARIVDGSGWVGDYDVALSSPDGTATFQVGGILIAEPESAEWVEELRAHFRIDVDDEGSARSIDPAVHPAETVDPGIMVVPRADADAPVRDKVAAADSAAMALVLRLSQPLTVHYIETSSVDETLCGGCASCVKTCAFGACSIDPETGQSHVDIRRCRGCGKCVVGCAVGARDIVTSPHPYLVAAVHSLAESDSPGPRVLGFLCGGCGYPAADSAGEFVAGGGGAYPASFLPLRIPCGGRLDTLYVLEAFKAGFDGVAVFRCREGHCHNLIGNLDMDRRMNLLRTVLRSRGLDDLRLRIVDISPFEGEVFVAAVNDFVGDLSKLANGKGGPQ